jgi:raffinose/stachyose/melibiose transport system substrate-binding protein
LKGGNLNEDFGVAKFGNGVRMVATGEAAHYPMLTFTLGNVKQNFPENRNDLGFFAQPGPDAAKNGLPVWMPAALYIQAASQNHEPAKDFMSFVASVEGCNRMIGANGAAGPLPDQGLRASSRCAARSGRHAALLPGRNGTAPALAFLSPIKARPWSRSPSKPVPASVGLPRLRCNTTMTSKSGPNSLVCQTGDPPAR